MKRMLVSIAICLVLILISACSYSVYLQNTPLKTTFGTELSRTPVGEESTVVKELSALADFNNDGDKETVKIVDFNGQYFELQVCDSIGNLLWKTKATKEHVGWFSVFHCHLDGTDYLLEYTPFVSNGSFLYEYNLFTLDVSGKEQIVESRSVEFDTNFGTSEHKSFNPDEISKFMKSINSYLSNSTVLLNTNEKLNTDDNSQINDRLWWLDEADGFTYDPSDDLGKILKDFKEYLEKAK